MPLYEYDCPECGRFEVLQKFNDKPLKVCPKCSEDGRRNKVERAVSAASFHLKGSGWYKTDYASSSTSSNGKAKGSSAGAAKTDTAKAETVKPPASAPAAAGESSKMH